MTGILYSRLPTAADTSDIHLWTRDGDEWSPVCSEKKYTEGGVDGNNVLIEDGTGNKTILRVTQKESFKQANSGYCEQCLENHPKIKSEWDF